jgi:hypothetical protein
VTGGRLVAPSAPIWVTLVSSERPVEGLVV